MSESIILAIIAVASPIIIGILKELLAAKKVKQDSVTATLASTERHTEFLNKQLQELRAYHEKQMEVWRDRYEKLHASFVEMREQKLRAEWQLERLKEASEAEED